jgi:tetratricopeptide (TPR) repeat protein
MRPAGGRAAGRGLLPALLLTLFIASAALVASVALPRPALAQPVKAEVSASVENGFARLIFLLAEDVESEVRVAGNIVIVSFQRPVEINLERLSASAGEFISAARRDPDGKTVRIALARKVTLNSIPAGERLFVDLLPESWSGLPPGLPREVIEELARRVRDADRKARQQQTQARQSKLAPIRVRVVKQPTFTRYVFQLPDATAVAANHVRDKLTLTFDAVLKFDLADAKATLPPMVEAIDSALEGEAVTVRFTLADKVDIRTFREDNSYIVDVNISDSRRSQQDGTVRSDELAALALESAIRKNEPPAGIEAPKTVLARPAQPETSTTVITPTTAPRRKPSEAVAAPLSPPAAAPARAPSPPVLTPAPNSGHAGSAPLEASPALAAMLKREGDNLSLIFPFSAPTPAAVFRRGDTLWLVFDTEAAISVAALDAEPSHTIARASATRERDLSVVRIKLERPRLTSVTSDGRGWTITLGAEMAEPTRPLAISRNIIVPARSSVTVRIDEPQQLHRLHDPEAGDTLWVVTALGPARGFLRSQDFVEFRALASSHGIVLLPLADDLNAELAADKVIITRPAGLTLSAVVDNESRGAVYRPHVLDARLWGFDRQAEFGERRSQLTLAAAEAQDAKRLPARVDLARFYLARDMAQEAKAVLDVTLADQPPTVEDPTALVLRAVAQILMGRPEPALKDLTNPFVGNQYDAPLWRALAHARLSKWTDAREGFRNVEAVLGTLPIELQRVIVKEMVRAAIEVGDITGAINELQEFESIGIPREAEASVWVLAGRLAEKRGRVDEAFKAYRLAGDSTDRAAAAQGRLRELVLQHTLGHLKRAAAIGNLETLTTVWRGDETELEALQLLARLYTDEGRYREAFQIMRTAVTVHQNSDITRRIQDEAAATFDSVFLAGRGDALPAIEALALFYDFRELTPIGRRGDEMIRRLADRLVSVDLLYQASELLQHQVDHRLQGAARAQVATRLAVIYLLDRKPDRAAAALRSTRTADLTNELRSQRLLLEARSLSDLGRHDVALEVIGNIDSREATRLRSDILWAARRWRQAAEQIELFYGERWRQFEPLSDTERADILRAAIGYALGEDAIGLARFRERYLDKMNESPDSRSFEVITAPIGASGAEFHDIARTVAAVDTLGGFLRDLRTRYPETGALPAVQRQSAAPAGPTAPAPQTAPARSNTPKADPETTGIIPGRPVSAVAQRPAQPPSASGKMLPLMPR